MRGVFFFRPTIAQSQELVEVMLHAGVALALVENLEIGVDERDPSAEEEGNLLWGDVFLSELGTARESGEIVGDGLWGMPHALTDLGGRLALEREADDLGAVGQDGTEIMQGAAHGNEHIGIVLADDDEIAGDGSGGDEEDTEGEILGSEERALTEGLLAKIKESRLSKGSRPVLGDELVVFDTAMEGEGDGLFVAVGDGLTGRLIGGDSDECHLTGSSDGRPRCAIGP